MTLIHADIGASSTYHKLNHVPSADISVYQALYPVSRIGAHTAGCEIYQSIEDILVYGLVLIGVPTQVVLFMQ